MKSAPLHQLQLLILSVFAICPLIIFSQTYTLIKQRPAQLDISSYKQIAIGDIVNALGATDEKSMDLSDEISSKLLNNKDYEVLDRNALNQILSSQRNGLKLIDEKTVGELSRKLNSALLISGRIQTEKLAQKQNSENMIIVVNGCNTQYHWVVTGDITAQIKIIDIKTGKMLFAGPVSKAIRVESTRTCAPTEKFDLNPIIKKGITDLATEVTKLVTPYKEEIDIVFQTSVITVFKDPFKRLKQVVAYFTVGDFNKGIQILKEYVDDNSLKNNLKSKAHFNYGLGLFCNKQYDEAKTEIKTAITLEPYNPAYQSWYERIDKERTMDGKIAQR